MTQSTKIYLSVLFSAASFCAVAQDTSRTINITSTYRPELRVPAKINFSGTQLSPEKTVPELSYQIPKQNLFYSYVPISLRPLALQADTSINLGDRYFVKAGFGNLTTPYFRGGASFGDGRTSLVNITADYHSAKGKDIQFQDYTSLAVQMNGSYFLPKSELFGGLHFSKNDRFLYGYDHVAFPNVSKADIKQNYQDIGLTTGFKNTAVNKLGINYRPTLEVDYFKNGNVADELLGKANVPIQKNFTDEFSAKVDFTAEISRYKLKTGTTDSSFNNNLVYVTPSLSYNSELIKLQAGVTPAWNNGDFNLLPDFRGEIHIATQIFSLQGGWVGRYIKNSYKSLTSHNPYIAPITSQYNTKEVEYYGGIKATVANHFTVNATAGLVKYTDLPLFLNDVSLGSAENVLLVVNESKIKNFRVRGDISYIAQQKFSFNAGLTLNAYTGLKDNDKAWGTLPMEFTGALRWKPIKNLQVKSDLYLFSGTKYLTKSSDTKTTDGGTDLSAGAEYKINKQFSIWADVNNILNDKYERWHNYQVYGTNFVGGILIRF